MIPSILGRAFMILAGLGAYLVLVAGLWSEHLEGDRYEAVMTVLLTICLVLYILTWVFA